MKNVKIAFWVILFGFIALILYQNREFYMSQHSLGMDLMVFKYHTPEVPNAILFLGFFFAGLLISYFFSLFDRYNSRKTIKNLSTSLTASEKILDALKMENEALKGAKAQAPEPEVAKTVEPDLAAVEKVEDDPKDSDVS